MLTNRLLTISLLLSLVAISATAHAGSTISDKSYWPSEARRPAPGVAAPEDAFGSASLPTVVPRFEIAPRAEVGRNGPRYHGGPKSQ